MACMSKKTLEALWELENKIGEALGGTDSLFSHPKWLSATTKHDLNLIELDLLAVHSQVLRLIENVTSSG